MRTKTTNSKLSINAVAAALIMGSFSSCLDIDSKVNGNNETNSEYAESFSNYQSIEVNIDSDFDGLLFSVFFKYPYSNGDLVEQPFLMAKAPFSTTLNVPNDVDSLYVISNGELTKYAKGNISANIKTSYATKAASSELDLNKISAIVNSNYFPEKSNNIKGDDLYKCTDIVIAKTPSSEEFDKANIWITYLTDGGFSLSNLYGKLWFYTYPSEKMNNLTLEDCTFYGKNAAGEIIPVSYSSISGLNNNQNETNDNYIFWSKKENANVKKGIHTKVDLGSFEKGNNIGFVFRGTSERCQFTTPSLNISSDTHSYINKSFNYRDKSGSFTPTQNVSNGFMCHIIDPEFELNILGMENRSTNHNSYDGDYNDMICIVETNPIALRPAEEVIPSDLDEYVLEKGLYLFEDNYPYAGDFDFNDVVIEYEIFSYINNSAEKGKKANVKLLAYGSAFTNEFGFKSGEEYIPLFTGIMGKENVHNEVTEILDEKTQTFSNAELKPYLHNGRGYILDSNYNTGEYPYVLIIPSTNNASSEFCWCKESKKISDAYDFDYPRAADWYLTPINKDLVITRK